MSTAPRAIRVTRLQIASGSVAGDYVEVRTVLPVSRIDEVFEVNLTKWDENRQPEPMKASQVTKVNGDFFYAKESPGEIQDMINGLT